MDDSKSLRRYFVMTGYYFLYSKVELFVENFFHLFFLSESESRLYALRLA